MNPQPCSFMFNSPSTAGLKPKVSAQGVTSAAELKHTQQFVQALGPPGNICSSGFQGAERCSHHIWSSTAVPQPNPPLTGTSPELQMQPGAKDGRTKSNRQPDFFFSHHQISKRKLWQFLEKLHQKISLCWEEARLSNLIWLV